MSGGSPFTISVTGSILHGTIVIQFPGSFADWETAHLKDLLLLSLRLNEYYMSTDRIQKYAGTSSNEKNFTDKTRVHENMK